MITFITIIILLSIICIIAIAFINLKNAIYCKNIEIFNNNFKNNKNKYKYVKLKKSNSNQFLTISLSTKNKPLYILKDLFTNKQYYLTLSKFIDYKINTNKNKYRSKNNLVLIEGVADLVFYDFKQTNNSNIFYNYKKIYKSQGLKQKENKIFKLLIGKKLVYYLSELIEELNTLSKIINKAKNAKSIKNYNNLLYLLAEYYSLLKYNKNSTSLTLSLNPDKLLDINSFFIELDDYNKRISKITSYLRAMFN